MQRDGWRYNWQSAIVEASLILHFRCSCKQTKYQTYPTTPQHISKALLGLKRNITYVYLDWDVGMGALGVGAAFLGA